MTTTAITIRNSSSLTVSWFCFNQLDAAKLIALGSGDIPPKQTSIYAPPNNINGFYGVRFTKQGGGLELAEGSVAQNGYIELVEGVGGDETYTTSVLAPDPDNGWAELVKELRGD